MTTPPPLSASVLLSKHSPQKWAELLEKKIPTRRALVWPPPLSDEFLQLEDLSRQLATMQPTLVFASLVCISVWCNELGTRCFGASSAELFQYIWCFLMRNRWDVPEVISSKPLALLIVDKRFWDYVGEYSTPEFPLSIPPTFASEQITTWRELIDKALSPTMVEAAKMAFL